MPLTSSFKTTVGTAARHIDVIISRTAMDQLRSVTPQGQPDDATIVSHHRPLIDTIVIDKLARADVGAESVEVTGQDVTSFPAIAARLPVQGAA